MRARLIAALLAVLCLPALAQTVPPFDPGSAPTESTWNAYFAAKQDLLTGTWATGQTFNGPATFNGAVTFANPIALPGPYSAAGTAVPTCNTGAKGELLYATDITTMTYNATYVSGGALIGPLFCNGTNWTAH